MRGGGKSNMETINSRISNYLKKKMNFLFKCVLSDIEYEAKAFKIDPAFFNTKMKGYLKIRKTLFEHGNAILEFMDLTLKELELIPTKSIIYLKDEKELNGKKESSNEK